MSEQSEEDRKLPPRKVIHPSNKGKLTKYFYRALIAVFIALLIGLTVWGFKLLDD